MAELNRSLKTGSRVLDWGKDIRAYISSVVPSSLPASDVLLEPTQPECMCTNLKATSVLCVHKLATIHSSSIVRRLGQLPATMTVEVKSKLRTLLSI